MKSQKGETVTGGMWGLVETSCGGGDRKSKTEKNPTAAKMGGGTKLSISERCQGLVGPKSRKRKKEKRSSQNKKESHLYQNRKDGRLHMGGKDLGRPNSGGSNYMPCRWPSKRKFESQTQ